jgi:hypothetical protein|tara:strand:+ start:389 stop:586 length:198 start_codon:yes stop_codon:yes gene_type:complete
MSKKEIIEKIVATTGCSEEKAKMIFEKAIQNKDIVATLDWEWVMNRLVISAVILVGLWALWKHIG